MKKETLELKNFNVFYTLMPVEYETVVEAESEQKAMKIVLDHLKAMGHDDASVREGWEVHGD